jgi:ornithine cyclodeaminase
VSTKIYYLNQIKEVLEDLDLMTAIEEGFVAYSRGKAVVPPVGELVFDNPPGDVHIKYGYITGDEYYVVKIASGFYENLKYNIPSSSGLMLLFKQKTGELSAILLDEGVLTNVRTAVAGAIAARYLAPKTVTCIGIIGAGIQGRKQLEYLKSVVSCRDVLAWGINERELVAYKEDMESFGYRVQTTLSIDEIASECNLMVTATPSQNPLLHADQIKDGTHITAVGSDTPQKNELDPAILQKANIVVADSIRQSQSRGEIFQARKAGLLNENTLVELGQVIANKKLGRAREDQISVVDLTGVAVQDIQVARTVLQRLQGESGV